MDTKLYKMSSLFDRDAKPIRLEVDDEDLVLDCDHPDGMKFVLQFTEPIATKPRVNLLAYAARGQYQINEDQDENDKRAAGRVSKADDEPEVGVVEVTKTDEDKRLAFGWAYITHDKDGNLIVDKSGEYVDDPDELEKAAYNYVVKSRHQGDMHRRTMANETLPVGTLVESMVFTPEKIAKMGLPPGSMPTGWWVGFKVQDDQAWGAIKNGERKSFSIHGKAVRKEH